MKDEKENRGRMSRAEDRAGARAAGRGFDGIAWQNKDITAKVMADHFRGKSLEAYGLRLPKVVDVRPTNLPAIEANELKIDNVFELADGSHAIIDYESVYRASDKLKYLGYIARLSKRLYNETGRFLPLRVIVIYTADVKRGNTNPVLDMGAIRMELTEAFLSELDSEEIRGRISEKLDNGEVLDDTDLMQLIIYPLTYAGNAAKRDAIGRAIDLAERIADRTTETFVLSGIGTFAGKVISEEEIRRIGRILNMTKFWKYYLEWTWEEAMERVRRENMGEIKEEMERVRRENMGEIKEEMERVRRENMGEIKEEMERVRKERIGEIEKEAEYVRKERMGEIEKETEHVRKERMGEIEGEMEYVRKEKMGKLEEELEKLRNEIMAKMRNEIEREVREEMAEKGARYRYSAP